jgi:hypothetical protein
VLDTCVPTYHGGNIAVSLSSDSSAQPKGKINIASSAAGSCYFDTGSDGEAIFGASATQAQLSSQCQAHVDPADCCASLGGTIASGCDDKEIKATLTLPKSLCDIKFKASDETKLEGTECGGAEPYVKVKVEIEKSTTVEGEYEIKVSGSFCSCCGAGADVGGAD